VRIPCLLAAAMTAVGSAAAAQVAQPDPGRDIAASCANCHGANGVSVGVTASLAGVPKQDMVAKLREFKSGARAGTIMPQLAKGYTDEQIELAAAWFAAQPRAK
jgi:sulfide dehydrogenase cytochrome subunit